MTGSPDIDLRKWDFLRGIRASEVDSRAAPQIYRQFVDFLDASASKPAHYVRYCQTFLGMAPYLDRLPGIVVLETGGFCDISRFLKSKGFDCRKTTGDLRYSINAETESVDLVLSLEVIEHIKDQTEETFSDVVLFRGTGVRQYVSEMQRVLKRGGLLVLTTPNPCSARTLELLLAQRPPMVFRPHVREFSRDELLELFSEMELVERTTHYTFFHLDARSRGPTQKLFERNGWDYKDRGDDHFMVFRKK